MRRLSLNGRTAIAALFFCLSAGRAWTLDDKVTLYRNNELLNGHVTKDESSGVDLEITGQGSRQLQPTEVADIDWDISDKEWRTAIAQYKSGGYGSAAQRLAGLISEKESLDAFRREAKPYLFYVYADCLYHMGKLSEAVPLFEKFINENKSSRYVPTAVGSLVDAAIEGHSFEKITPLLALLRSQGPEQKAQADFYEGRMLLAQGKPRDAESKFVAAASGSSVPDAKGMALMGQAECAIGDKNITKARELAQRALTASPSAVVSGAAHLVIGDTLIAEVDTQHPAGEALENKLLDALLEYMRVTEQYRGDPRTEPNALLKAGECLQRMSALPNHGGDRQRAISMFGRLTSDTKYRNTSWAAEAEKDMQKFR